MPSLTAAIVILTGITGATLSSAILDTVGVRRDDLRGFAMGVASHGIGTAKAFQVSEEAGAWQMLNRDYTRNVRYKNPRGPAWNPSARIRPPDNLVYRCIRRDSGMPGWVARVTINGVSVFRG
ncbi:LrgB family protein [Paraburkholderia atlantica]|uniref:LrgB family protein n=1 Tax=Paraburkholderia atlantica TaxID=2654982 RepID=UPI001611B3D7